MTAGPLRHCCAVLLLALLVGCGGGDPEDTPDQATPRVDCAATPELCK